MSRLASERVVGAAGMAAGALLFAGQAGELVTRAEARPLQALFVALGAASIASLAVAFLGLRGLLTGSRLGSVASVIGFVGALLLAAFAVQAMISVARTGDVPDNFALFGLGFLLVLIAHLALARPLRRLLGSRWWLSLAAAAGILVAIVVAADPIHDLGLFLFEGSWVAIGWLIMRDARRPSATHAG